MQGCATTPPPIPPPTYIEKSIEIKPRPEGLAFLPMYFTVVNEKILPNYIAANRFRNGSVVFIALDIQDYENLSLNRAEMQRYLEQMISLVEYYEEQVSSPTVNEQEQP